jgi:hypothetical protein
MTSCTRSRASSLVSSRATCVLAVPTVMFPRRRSRRWTFPGPPAFKSYLKAGDTAPLWVSEGGLEPGTGEISLNPGLNSNTGEKFPGRGFRAATVAGAPRLASSGLRRTPHAGPRRRARDGKKQGRPGPPTHYPRRWSRAFRPLVRSGRQHLPGLGHAVARPAPGRPAEHPRELALG